MEWVGLILTRRILYQWILDRGGQSGSIRVFIDGNLSFAVMGSRSFTDGTGLENRIALAFIG